MPLAVPNSVVATTYPQPLGVEAGIPYTLIGADGSRAVLNDTTSPDWVGFLSEPPSGLERAGVRESFALLPEGDGGVHGTFRRDRLPFTLTGWIPPDPAGTWILRQAKLLRATAALEKDATLQFTPSGLGGASVFCQFREQNPTRITGKRPKAFLVAGVAEDPVLYNVAAGSIVAALLGASSGGFASPLRSLLGSNASVLGQAIAAVLGTIPTWPVITITGPMTNPVVTNYTAGKSLYLNYTLAAGDTLVIDTNPRRRSVRLNDQANRYSAYDFSRSNWWPLTPGNNDIRLAVSAYSAGASFRVDWRDAWG